MSKEHLTHRNSSNNGLKEGSPSFLMQISVLFLQTFKNQLWRKKKQPFAESLLSTGYYVHV